MYGDDVVAILAGGSSTSRMFIAAAAESWGTERRSRRMGELTWRQSCRQSSD